MPLRKHAPVCLADLIVNLLRGKWAMHILHRLDPDEAMHFNALLRGIPGISAKVLNEQLGYLTEGGVLQRVPTASARREVIYGYTERGKELRLVLDSLNELAGRWEMPVTDSADDAQSAEIIALQPTADSE